MRSVNTTTAKSNEAKAWFRLHFMPSGQEMDWAYCTARRASTGQSFQNSLQGKKYNSSTNNDSKK